MVSRSPSSPSVSAGYQSALILTLCTIACYANSLAGAFVLDDLVAIKSNDSLANLWDTHRLTSMRGLVDFSFAVNRAVGGVHPLGYHLVNLAIHILAGLVLCGLVARTLSLPSIPVRLAERARPLALAVALLWLLHPLDTEAVTYVCQRYESLAACFYLLVMYAFCRGMQEEDRRRMWFGAALLAFAAGLRSKETVITLPLVLMWYDRVFFAGSWRAVWDRKFFYLALLGVALALAGAVALPALASLARQLIGAPAAPAAAPIGTESTVLSVEGTSPLAYLAAQPAAWAHYLRLCFWPVGQCLDSGWPVPQTTADMLPGWIAVGLVVSGLAWLAIRYPRVGFLVGAPLLILAPTSSLIPFSDVMVEHRMYLPLAGITTLVVLAADRVLGIMLPTEGGAIDWEAQGGAGKLLLIAVGLALASLTVIRNADYRTARIMFENNCAQYPQFWRPHVNLSQAMLDEGDLLGAEQEASLAVELNPGRGELWIKRGVLRDAEHRYQEALADFSRGAELEPHNPEAHYNRAWLEYKLGDFNSSAADCRRALEIDAGHQRSQTLLKEIARRTPVKSQPPEQSKSGPASPPQTAPDAIDE